MSLDFDYELSGQRTSLCIVFLASHLNQDKHKSLVSVHTTLFSRFAVSTVLAILAFSVPHKTDKNDQNRLT